MDGRSLPVTVMWHVLMQRNLSSCCSYLCFLFQLVGYDYARILSFLTLSWTLMLV